MSVDPTYPTGSEGPPSQERADPPELIREQPDSARRRALVAATTAAGGIGLTVATVPFIASMLPSERAKAAGAPVEIDISNVEPGTLLTVEWQGKPVWILHRTEAMLRCSGTVIAGWATPTRTCSSNPHTARTPRARLIRNTSYR